MRNVFLIPTDKPSRLLLSNRNNLQFLHDNASTNPNNHFKGIYQNLYITSDEEIKEGDWFLYQEKLLVKHDGSMNTMLDCKKIILTTDIDLIKDGEKIIGDDFLQWFVKNQSCELVEVIEHTKRLLFLEEYIPTYKIIIPKEVQRQHIIDMMQEDEKLGLYEGFKQEVTGTDDNRPKPNYCYAKEELHNEIGCAFPACHCDLPIKIPKQETLEEAAKNYNSMLMVDESFIAGAKWQQERMYSEEDMREAFKQGHKASRQLGSYNKITEQEDYSKWFAQFKKK